MNEEINITMEIEVQPFVEKLFIFAISCNPEVALPLFAIAAMVSDLELCNVTGLARDSKIP
jgi:hypothetical protein